MLTERYDVAVNRKKSSKLKEIDEQKLGTNERARISQQLEDLARFPQENPNPVMRADSDGSILFVNAACSKLDFVTCQPGQPLPERYRKIVAQVLDTGSNQVIEVKGKERIFTLNFVPVTKAGYVNIYGSDITERKQAEKKLQETYRDLNRAQAVAQTGSWRLDVQRNVLLWSDENHHIFGIPEKTPMTYETFLSCVHPDDREYVDKRWQAALQGEEYDIEHRIVVGDEIKWVRERAELEFDKDGMLTGGFGTTEDITERKKMEEDLRQTRDYLDNLFNYANAPIIVWNREFKVTRFNHAFERLTGRSADEVLGGTLDILFPDDSRDESMKHIREATSGERWEVVEIPIKHKDGTVHILLWNSATLYDTDGQTPLATIAQGQDITERKKVEQLKDEFIGLVSHELKTPLTVVTGAIHTAMDERVSPEERHRLLEDAAWGAESLANILNNLLELSRHQADRLTLDRKSVDIREIADKAAKAVGKQHPTYVMSLDIPSRLQLVVDPGRLERIFINLIDNACKYSPEGSEVRVFTRQGKQEVVIGVSDQGVGIAPEDQEDLFEPFSRVGLESRIQGIGLGLVVCRRLVEAHGGRIWVESNPDGGSTFLFTIPLEKE
jgi:PAS domain S-box-containing protein